MFHPTSPIEEQEPSTPLENNPFYPDLELADFRTTMRVDNLATPERALFALSAGMMETNRRLIPFQHASEEQGHQTLAEVPASYGQPTNEKTTLYKRAVYALAKANLIERYRDYDSSAKAQNRADELEENIDELRRDAAWAINDIMGIGRVTVELI